MSYGKALKYKKGHHLSIRYNLYLTGKERISLTGFEKTVLRAVCSIPLGQTRSYKWVASRIGMPRSSRAVGEALNKNPFPLLIPCHRVVCSNGDIGGYSGGVKNKKKLLAFEKKIVEMIKDKKIK